MSNWYLDNLRPDEPANPKVQGTITASDKTTMEITLDSGRVLGTSTEEDGKPLNEMYPVGARVALRSLDNPS